MKPVGIAWTYWLSRRVGKRMQRLNLFFFHNVGYSLGHLASTAISDHKPDDWRWPTSLEAAKSWLELFATTKDPVLLPKSQAAALALLGALDSFKLLLVSAQGRAPVYQEWKHITEGIARFNNVYEQELEDTHVLWVTPIAAYSTSVLMEEADLHLSKQAQGSIDAKTKTDLKQSGRCLALDSPTASGFHSMRAVEAEARLYHQIVTKRAEPLSDVPLGPVINGKKDDFDGLRDQWAEEGSKNDSNLGLIISLLSQINKIYRCPITHPEMTLDDEGAKLVFDLSCIAISAMISDGDERKAGKN